MMNALKSIFVFAVVLTASLWAANQDIAPTAFIAKEPLEVKPTQPLLPDLGGKILPSMPSRMEPGFLYLRKKLDAKTYAWYKGKPTPDAFHQLKAFAPGILSTDSLVRVKFYASRLEKAFQDEPEIYFDRNFIYSTRVPKLFFAENDQWVELNAKEIGIGSVDVSTNVPAKVLLDGDSLGVSPVLKQGVVSGLHTLKLSAPGFLPIVSGVLVTPGQTSRKNLLLTAIDSSSFSLPKTVAMSTVLDATTLPQLEPVWDKLQTEKQAYEAYLTQQRHSFDQAYPKLMPAPVGVSTAEPGYQRYRDAYNQTHDEAYGLFLSSVLPGGKELEEILRVAQLHKDSLELLTLKAKVVVEGIKVMGQTKGVADLQIKFKSPDGRIDAGWTGAWKDSLLSLDSLQHVGLTISDPWLFEVTFQNKPVKIQSDTVQIRRQYRLVSLQLIGPTRTVTLQGSFVLPDYIQRQIEVQAWLGSFVQKLGAENAAVIHVEAPKAIDERPIWLKALRGDVAEIDGGTFRYKGKSVEMSPFAIDKTEVTQEHYKRIMLENPAERRHGKIIGAHKPVFNITWEEADNFCTEIGGKLPTEAQWEYAARAGSSSGELWLNDLSTPADYAVYAANSLEKGKKDPAYGPHDVAQGRPNAWGLYDVHGNVAEWTHDYDSWLHFFVDSKDPDGAFWGSDRVFKGGGWMNDVDDIKLTAKDYEDPRYWGASLGFRCAFPSHQSRSLDSIKVYLLKHDSIATAKGIVLLGGTMRQIIANANESAPKTLVLVPPPVVKTILPSDLSSSVKTSSSSTVVVPVTAPAKPLSSSNSSSSATAPSSSLSASSSALTSSSSAAVSVSNSSSAATVPTLAPPVAVPPVAPPPPPPATPAVTNPASK